MLNLSFPMRWLEERTKLSKFSRTDMILLYSNNKGKYVPFGTPIKPSIEHIKIYHHWVVEISRNIYWALLHQFPMDYMNSIRIFSQVLFQKDLVNLESILIRYLLLCFHKNNNVSFRTMILTWSWEIINCK